MRPLLFAIIVCVATFPLSAAEDESPKGRLCILASVEAITVASCPEGSGVVLAVPAAEEARRFAWMSVDGKRLLLGSIPARSATVSLEGKLVMARLNIRGDERRGWPAPLELEMNDSEAAWRLALTGEEASRLREIHAPAGTYEIGLDAGHHQPFTRANIVLAEKPVDLGSLTLKPRPLLTGTAMAEDGTPLGGATLVDDYGELLAKADVMGRISYEAACERRCDLPARVAIGYPGLADSRVLVTEVAGDFDMGRIVLGRGGVLELKITFSDGSEEEVRTKIVEVEEQGDPRKPRVLVERALGVPGEPIRFEKLPAGRAALFLSGDGAAEIYSTYVEIEAGKETTEEIDIHPTELKIVVRKGDALAAGAEVKVGVPHGTPDYDVQLGKTDSDGRIATTVWQEGTMVASATLGEASELEFFQVGEVRERDLEIRISPTVLRGRVYDAETDEPVAKTRVSYSWKGNNSEAYSSVMTDDGGSYQIQGAQPGVHKLNAQIDGYLPSEARVETHGGELETTLDLPLTRGELQNVKISWADGRAVTNALVLRIIEHGKRHQRWTSDASGAISVPMAPGSRIDVWVIPREGSFAFTTIAQSSEPVSITVPLPAGSLVVRTVDEFGNPAPSSHLGLRHAGNLIDSFVAGAIGATQGFRFRTGSDGTVVLRGLPGGQYELWAIQYDGNDIAIGEPHNQPITRFYFAGGEQTVSVEVYEAE